MQIYKDKFNLQNQHLSYLCEILAFNGNMDNQESLELLERLISTPRCSREEKAAADILQQDIVSHGYKPERIGDNILCRSRWYDGSRPAILLNSHIDTVRPTASWTRDPYRPVIENGCLYGIGSNDAGASLVSLLQAFYQIDSRQNSLNLLFLATCQEEVSGEGGMKQMAPLLPEISFALVGEPTGMQPAIAEKGLMVLDVNVHGRSGHAARDEGINAIYRAVDVVSMLRDYRFERESALLGPVRMTVTVMHSGTQHNVIPDLCTMTVDVRSNECYSNREIFGIIRSMLPEWCDVHAHSFTLNSSGISPEHPIIRRAAAMGLTPFGSPTLSDQAILNCPSFKMGPGDSARSHTADEYIRLKELADAVPAYIALLNQGT